MNQEVQVEPCSVTFIGPLPPPVTGMTAMTEVIVRALKLEGPVTCFNWSRGKPLQGLNWRVARCWGFVKSCWGLVFRGRQSGQTLYYLANSAWGILYDILLLSLARVLGYRIVLHHHSYSYLDCYDWRMGIVTKLVGDEGAHAVHCQKMVDDFLQVYPSHAKFLIVPPTIVSSGLKVPDRAQEATEHAEKAFVLGFLSNITRAKGIHLVLETFEALCERSNEVRLILAGPCMERHAKELVKSALARWPEQVEYRGPVYDEQKASFFTDINAFLFPTQYKNESWGIVLTEALSAGRPVISCDRGCVSYIIRNGCGLIVAKDGNFVTEATKLISQWMIEPETYQNACHAAVARSIELEQEASDQLSHFTREIRIEKCYARSY